MIDEDTLKRWKEADKLFRFRWWSPVFLLRYLKVRRGMHKEAKRIVSKMPKPRLRG